MNYQRISELYALLEEEFGKNPVNNKRMGEICHYLSAEFAAKPSLWSRLSGIVVPANWKIYITAAIAALIAVNTQLHFVTPDVANALIGVAVALGFWTVHTTQTTQNLQIEKVRMLLHKN